MTFDHSRARPRFASGAGRSCVLPALRPLHAGLPQPCAAACLVAGRHGRALFPCPCPKEWGLSARVCALRYCLPDTRHIAPASFREEMGQGGHSHSQKGSLSCLGRGQALYGVQGKVPLRCSGRCRPARARGCGSGCGRDALLWVRILRTSLPETRISHSR